MRHYANWKPRAWSTRGTDNNRSGQSYKACVQNWLGRIRRPRSNLPGERE